jgi:carbonic anhydrase
MLQNRLTIAAARLGNRTSDYSSEYERALSENKRCALGFDRSKRGVPPGRKLAVVACMDARLTVEDILGLRSGDAHIIRNAGGLATDDAIRSLVISQTLLGTEEIIVIEHTDCGMLTFNDDAVRQELTARTGKNVDLPLRPFGDLHENLRVQLALLREHPWIKDVPIHGLIFEVETGLLVPIE